VGAPRRPLPTPPSTRSSPAGAEVGAVRALLGSVHALLREPAVTHVAVAFDTAIESFRNRLFDGDKTGEGMDPILFAQSPLAERVLVALGVTVRPVIAASVPGSTRAAPTHARRARDAQETPQAVADRVGPRGIGEDRG
jgi:hypothetical protein